MKITVTTLTDDIFVLDVSEDLELENFKAFCEVESGMPGPQILVIFNGRPLMDNKKSLKAYGISDGDCVVLQRINSSGGSSGGPRPGVGRVLGKWKVNVNKGLCCETQWQVVIDFSKTLWPCGVSQLESYHLIQRTLRL